MRGSESELEAQLRQLEPVRVWVLGEDALARSAVALQLATQLKITVVGQSAPGAEGPAADVVVFDLGLEPKSFTPVEGGTPVLALLPDPEHAAEVLAGGARGVLLRDADGARISAALRAIRHGLVVADESLAGSLAPARPSPELGEPLTPREREVLQLLSEGLSNKQIAQRLSVTDHTAKFHVNAILQKLGAESRTEAVVRAARLGLVVL